MPDPKKKEHLYDTSKLSIIFGILSVILFVVIVWLVIDDHTREWKKYQRSFNQLQLSKTQEELKKATGKARTSQLEKIKQELAAVNQELNSKKKELGEKLTIQKDLDRKLERAASTLQEQKSFLDSVRYQYETASAVHHDEHLVQMKDSREEKAKKLKSEMEEWQGKVKVSQNEVDELTKQKEKIDSEVNAFNRKREDLDLKLFQAQADEKRLNKKIDSLKPSFFNMLRNSPIFDFMAPTYKVRQLVMEDLYDDYNFVRVPKVDRCITCHTAIDLKGFENAPQPFRTHPKLDEFVGSGSPHPMEKFACTVCHGGNGQALTFYHSGHTPDSEEQAEEWEKKYHWHPLKHWEDPMLATKNIEASCIKCHQGFLNIPNAPKVNQGRLLVEELGCWSCHKIHGIENLRKVGPSLENVRGKVDPGWTAKWIKDPKSFRPDTKMPSFFGLSNSASEEEENVEVSAITAYLYAHSGEFNPGEVEDKGDPAKGKELTEKLGCLGCHSIGDITLNNFAPDLSSIGSKVSLPWLVDWLKNPKHYFPETAMPSMRLTDQEAVDIATYLLTLKDPKFDAAAEPEINKDILNKLVLDELRSSYTEKESEEQLKSMDEDEKKVYLGERLIGFYGCYACHTIKGFENAKEIGTELTEEGSKLAEQLDFGHIDIPHTRQAFFDTKLKTPRIFDKGRVRGRKEKLRMPKFNLTDEERSALVTYLTGLRREYIPLSKMRTPDAREQQVQDGLRIIRDHNCAGCHEIDPGVGGNIGKLVDDPGLAPPSIVGQGKRTQDKWLFDFIKNPTPVRPWLTFRMPTFGFTDEETDTLVKHFRAEDHVPLTFADTEAKPDKETLAEGKKLFEMLQCAKCHATTPGEGMAIKEGASAAELAPNLVLSKDRLRHNWIVDWIRNPDELMPGTRMPGFFPDGQTMLPDILGGDAEKQMTALRDYVVSLGDQPDKPKK